MAIEQDNGEWIGRSIPRLEDKALVTGHGRFIDDLGTRPGTLAAAILRSPHAHAEIEAVDCLAPRAADGVVAVLTIDRVRYVGEPVGESPAGMLADCADNEA